MTITKAYLRVGLFYCLLFTVYGYAGWLSGLGGYSGCPGSPGRSGRSGSPGISGRSGRSGRSGTFATAERDAKFTSACPRRAEHFLSREESKLAYSSEALKCLQSKRQARQCLSPGRSGKSGTSGTSGKSGTSGTSGRSGKSGTSESYKGFSPLKEGGKKGKGSDCGGGVIGFGREGGCGLISP